MKIPLQETEYDFDGIREKVIGAGVLPIAVDARGDVSVLLGKERYINHWRGSHKWSGFEGGRRPDEEVESTACREFLEESISSIRLTADANCNSSVLDFIHDSMYVARIVLCILHGSDVSDRKYHVTYLVEVPFSAEYVNTFANRRKSLMDLQMKEVQMSKLEQQVKCFGIGLPTEDDMWAAVVRVVDGASVFSVQVVTHDEETVVLPFPSAGQEEAETYRRWLSLRSTITADINSLEPECGRAVREERNSRDCVVSVKVNDDYVEKQCIKWWRYNDLCSVIQNGGYSNSEFFRPYFLPVLQRALDVVREAKERCNSEARSCHFLCSD